MTPAWAGVREYCANTREIVVCAILIIGMLCAQTLVLVNAKKHLSKSWISFNKIH